MAQQDTDQKRIHCEHKTILDAEFQQLLKNHCRLTYSPEAIAVKFKLATPSI
ncbi:hypothetical protein H3T41_05605 [Lactobacillus sp. W8089]|nr:hypothetical protein [Lactobacillus sp. W8086]MBI0109231.1 hypothetical protein [Lactobacillus sp. W8085]MBI0112384.1 hypothetical protein [Lactobacillus sp. W8088]MBI0116163.1 hypothetical protein [Lactobacillus sp. W8087]MBI0119825.1 hypothetical protein [Lactobacillus sp. W8089]MBI0131790.1 hypothetical protein [Lactobacillus sp. W8090]